MMGTEQTATGRPTQPIPLVPRIVLILSLAVAALEGGYRYGAAEGAGGPLLTKLLAPVWAHFIPARTWCVSHPVLVVVSALGVATLLLVAIRYWLLFWHNHVKARLTGTFFFPEVAGFPAHPFALLEYVARRPKGETFVGMRAARGFFGWRWVPFFITAKQRSMHCHVLGKTGSGKTASVIWPSVLQDALDSKGVLVMDAKGSDENIRTMKAIAALAGREAELKVFSLPAWNQPQLFSHTYNLV